MEEYTVVFKKVKHLTLRMKADLSLTVTAPFGTSRRLIAQFVEGQKNWIEKHQAQLRKRQAQLAESRLVNCYQHPGRVVFLGQYYPMYFADSLEKRYQWNGDSLTLYGCDTIEARWQQVEHFYRQQAKELFHQRNQIAAAKISDFGPAADLVIRKMRASWGRCYCQQNKIVLNLRLIQAPLECLDAVLFHEYMHFFQPNHSKTFYQLLEQYVPDHRQKNSILTTYIDITGEMEEQDETKNR